MNQRQLEAFRLVIKTGNISSAAQQLYVSQPTVSRLITDLEESIGLKLFERKQGKIHFRQEAFAFYDAVEKVFLGANYLRRVAEEIRHNIGVRLRVGAFPAFGLTLMPAIVGAFHADYPQVSFSLSVETSPSLGESISSGTTDMGIVAGRPNLPGTEIVRCFSAPCVCVVKSDDPLALKDSVTLQMIGERTIVWMDSLSQIEGTMRRSLKTPRGPSNGSLYVNLADSACRLVQLGHGVAVIDPITALSLPISDLMVRPVTPEIRFEFSVLRSEKMVLSKAAAAFTERLLARCEEIEH
jgi:DNA-binding transcriptional LysR family regulator